MKVRVYNKTERPTAEPDEGDITVSPTKQGAWMVSFWLLGGPPLGILGVFGEKDNAILFANAYVKEHA